MHTDQLQATRQTGPNDSDGSIRSGVCWIGIAQTVIPIVLYLAATIAITWPQALHMGTKTPYAGGDTALNAYILAWDQHAMLHNPLEIFDAPFLYPSKNTLALSENLFGVALLALPLTVFNNPLITLNVMIMCGFFLSACAWFVVLRRWGLGGLAAFLGGFLFGFMPWRFGHWGHAQLLFTWWIPGCVYFTERWIRLGGWRFVIGACACLAACFYSSVYHAFFTFQFLIPFAVAGWLLAGRTIPLKARARQILGGMALGVVLLAPALPKYYAIKRDLHSPNNSQITTTMSGELSDLIRPNSNNWLWGSRIRIPTRSDAMVPWEQNNFVGFGALSLAAMGLGVLGWQTGRRRLNPNDVTRDSGRSDAPEQWVLALMFLAGGMWLAMLSLGPFLHWNGARTEVTMPFRALFRFFPGAQSIRVPARATFMVGFALSGLAAIGFHQMSRLGSPVMRWLSRFVACCAGILALVECVDLPYPAMEEEPYARHLKVQAEIADMRRGPILVLPLDVKLNYMVPLTTCAHFYPTLNGVTGYLPSSNGEIFSYFRAAEWGNAQAEILRHLRVRYILIDLATNDPTTGTGPRRVEKFLSENGFIFEKIPYAAEKIVLFKIDPFFKSIAFDTLIHANGTPPGLIVQLMNNGEIMELKNEEREVIVSARGYDARGEDLWKDKRSILLPSFWIARDDPGTALITTKEKMADTERIKVRIEQEQLGYKAGIEFRRSGDEFIQE